MKSKHDIEVWPRAKERCRVPIQIVGTATIIMSIVIFVLNAKLLARMNIESFLQELPINIYVAGIAVHWALPLLLGLAAFWSVRRRILLRCIASGDACRHCMCGYSLVGASVTHNAVMCPECGNTSPLCLKCFGSVVPPLSSPAATAEAVRSDPNHDPD